MEELVRQIAKEVAKEVVGMIQPLLQEDTLLSTEEACELLGVTPVTLWKYAKDNKIHVRKIGRRNLYSKHELLYGTSGH